jgi:hypothetical protein
MQSKLHGAVSGPSCNRYMMGRVAARIRERIIERFKDARRGAGASDNGY